MRENAQAKAARLLVGGAVSILEVGPGHVLAESSAITAPTPSSTTGAGAAAARRTACARTRSRPFGSSGWRTDEEPPAG